MPNQLPTRARIHSRRFFAAGFAARLGSRGSVLGGGSEAVDVMPAGRLFNPLTNAHASAHAPHRVAGWLPAFLGR
jgi:hypothetical protein